ncbi:MAG: hypothetical protein E6571_09070 [Staphylococcus epidermidis]|nr:hypothetical protein [Staphylococcus epidermidis]
MSFYEQEKAFRCEVNKREYIRMPFSSENDAKNKLFNIVYAYNAVKNFKQAEDSRNRRSRNL